jgi:hypothetical protein
MDYPLRLQAALYDAGENYESRFPVQAGLLAGLGGSLSIMVIVTGILLLSGNDIWTAVRLIATSVEHDTGAIKDHRSSAMLSEQGHAMIVA